VIEVEHLSKTFRVPKKDPGFRGAVKALFRRETIVKEAVRDVSFRVEEGEIVGLIGANGAGKTTLVKMLAGIVHPSAGKARVLGFDPWRRDDAFRSQIALIMGQKAQLWWDLPAQDCFELLREIYRVPKDEHAAALAELKAILAVAEKDMSVQIRRLSLGERMKMELIAALLHRPRVVFLDEPTIGLDVSAQRSIREFLLAYREKRRPAMILTSHYMEDIETLCERVLVIRDGELVYDGALSRLVDRYAPVKVVTAHLRPGSPAPDAQALASLGDVLESTVDLVRVRVPRARTAEVAAALLARLPVADLAIQAPDVGTIVRQIFAERGKAP
jgi:ABC-2 type transport system ATP-binding protein